jgi:sugar phosphate permease
LVLGALEGGLFPGMTVYLTLFYTKRELALRIGYLFVSAALAGGLGGLLAYGIGHMDGVAGQRGWRWIFILEGLPAVVLGISCSWLLADEPETAFYLTAEEKALMIVRKERQIGHTKAADQMHREDVIKGLKDWKIWVFCVAQFGVDTVLYGYSTFLPTIIKGLGTWNTAQTQALTVPCYALGAITYLLVARLSDRQQRRGVYTVVFGAVTVVGYGVLISGTTTGGHYVGCFLVATGLYVTVGLPLSWLPSSEFPSKRGNEGGGVLTYCVQTSHAMASGPPPPGCS